MLFLALSCVRIFGDFRSAAFGGAVIDAAVSGGIWGTTLGHNLLVFATAEIFVHVALALICWGLALFSKLAWPANHNSERTWLIFWFTLCAIWLLIANAAFFPWSSLGSMYFEYVAAEWMGLSIFRVYTAAILLALTWLLFNVARRAKFTRPRARLAMPLIGFLFAGLVPLGLARHAVSARPSKPHVIIIGIDSLRNDAVETPQGDTPALDDFLASAVRFTDATTPLARTFPSWVSVITGKNPHTTGAVINLLPRELIHTGDTLPTLLSELGYRSVYAIDEVRFSNLDESYGFDRLVTPPIGATDFLLGFFGDVPLSNLLVNTRVGAALFPNLHANRAVAQLYNPDSFVKRLAREVDFDQPTLLVAHLTLPHWPYYWADAPQSPPGVADGTARRLYESAVRRTDRQFSDLMTLLKRRGALENAIVVLISDHGESLGVIDSSGRLGHTSPIGVEYEEQYLVGHGTSVFSPSQYQVVFAMKSYGNSAIPQSNMRIHSPVSLEDVTPTLLDLVGYPNPASSYDGQSLLPLVHGGSGAASPRIRFTETEFNPKGILPGFAMSASAMQKAAAYYRVEPKSDRVLVRSELLDEVLERRQFAALQGNKMLALVPIESPEGLIRRAVLVDSNSSVPQVIDHPETSGDPDVRGLWIALLTRYPSVAQQFQGDSTIDIH